MPVGAGFSCYSCCFLTVSRSAVQKHICKVHSKRSKEDKCIFARVGLQSLYGPKRKRYCVVNEGANGIGRDRAEKRVAGNATSRGITNGNEEEGEQDEVEE